MGNNQLLPFERNRYYVGKLLTAADFQAEQTYGEHKRRFLNEMLFGSGIVCGLGVYNLDDLSIMVDSGVALDGCGREIALDTMVVRKLSAVDGFEELKTERATLCIRYKTKDVHPVYTVRGQENGESYECNRVRESWQLVLRDSVDMIPATPPQSEYLTTATLYADESYKVTCTMPAQTALSARVRMDVAVTRLQEMVEPLSLKAVIQMPTFTDEDGNHELTLELNEVCPKETVVFHRYLKAQAAPAPESMMLADASAIQATIGDQDRMASERFALRVAVVEATVDQLVESAAAAASLEVRTVSGGQQDVPLAEILLQHTRNAYIIEEIRSIGVRNYVHTMADEAMRRELKKWFPGDAVVERQVPVQEIVQPLEETNTDMIYATGVCEIPLGVNMRRGQIAYSDEIVHGLGPGVVYVTVGPEYLSEDVKLGTTTRNTIYGNAGLFAREQPPVVLAETAVKVMNDRGSFVVAARMREDSNQVLLPLRWVAVALPGGKEDVKVEKLADKSIAAVQSTVVMATRESHFFNVRFNNMDPCTLTYELTEKNSGEITSEGIYTAPGHEGVFEIRISCADQPLITTYAYAVVKKKDLQDEKT